MTRRKQSNDHCVLNGYEWNGGTSRNSDCWGRREREREREIKRERITGIAHTMEEYWYKSVVIERWAETREGSCLQWRYCRSWWSFNNDWLPATAAADSTASLSTDTFPAARYSRVRATPRRLDYRLPTGSHFLMQRIAMVFSFSSETRIDEADKLAPDRRACVTLLPVVFSCFDLTAGTARRVKLYRAMLRYFTPIGSADFENENISSAPSGYRRTFQSDATRAW